MTALERFPGGDRRTEIRYGPTENYSTMGRYEDAAAHLARVPEETASRTLAFEARLRLSEVLLTMGRAESALEVAVDLEGRTIDRGELDRVELQKGLALEALGEHERAINTYEEIAASHERSEGASKAYYRIGVVRRDALGDLDGAVEAFRASRDAFARGETAELATQAADDIVRLREYRRIIDDYEQMVEERAAADEAPGDGDASAAEGAVSGERDTIGAVADTGAAIPDTTAAVADTGAAAPDTTGAVADTGAAAPDTTIAVPDTTAAVADTARTAPAAPPETERRRASAAGDTTALTPEEEAARARFLLAELQLFRFDDAARALEVYREVLELHPETEYAPRAALAVGWVLERELQDLEAARAAYRRVIDSYPGTERAEAAALALERLESTPGAAASGGGR